MKKLYLKNEVIKKTFQDNQRMVMDAFIPIPNTNLEFTGNSLVYVVDYKDVTASTSPFSVYLKTPTQFKVYGNQGLTRVNRLPVTYKMETMNDMFTLCFALNFIDFSNWDTSNIKTMYNAFASTGFEGPDGMPYVNNLNLRSCADFSYAFSTCINLTDIDLSNWQLGSAQTTEAMFYGDSMLRTADLRNWNTSTITNMSRMFENCDNLTDIYIDNWNTSNVQNMSRMFANCSGLDMQTLIDKIDFSSATDISYMFMNCKVDGDTLDLSNKTFMNWDGRNSTISGFTSGVTVNELKYFKKVGTNVPKISHISTACTAVDFSNWDTSNITNMSGMFYNLDGTSQVKKVTFGAVDRSTIQDVQTMFYRSIVEELDSENMVFPNLTNVYNCFNGASSLTTLDLRGWNMSQVNNLGGLFSGCTSLVEVNLSGWDLSHLTDARYYSNMFRNCSSLEKIYACDCNQATISVLTSALQTAGINVGVLITECAEEVPFKFVARNISNTTKSSMVTNLNGTQQTYADVTPSSAVTEYEIYLSDHTSLPLTSMASGFTQMLTSSSMFSQNGFVFTEITSFPDTSQVTDMSHLFEQNINGGSMWTGYPTGYTLTNISAVEQFNTSSVANMNSMFANFSGATGTGITAAPKAYVQVPSMNLSNWNVSNVTDMGKMFYNNVYLTTLDLSGWDCSNVTEYADMFKNCKSLTSINMSNCNEYTIQFIKDRLADAGIDTSIVKAWYSLGDVVGTDTQVRHMRFNTSEPKLTNYVIYAKVNVGIGDADATFTPNYDKPTELVCNVGDLGIEVTFDLSQNVTFNGLNVGDYTVDYITINSIDGYEAEEAKTMIQVASE